MLGLWCLRARSGSDAIYLSGGDWLPHNCLFLLLIGLSLFVSSLRRFATDGEGTLAPWDPHLNGTRTRKINANLALPGSMPQALAHLGSAVQYIGAP